jgi:hypothetical protein
MDIARTETESTRYLCAAVQLDRKLCKQIIKEFLEEDYTVIGVCHGVDIPTVLKSCLLAEKRRNKRDIYLFGLSIIAIVSLRFEIVVLLYCIAWVIVYWDKRITRYEIVGNNFLKSNFSAEKLSKVFDKNFPMKKFNPEEVFDFSYNSDIRRKLDAIAITQDANVIIYAGFSPFVGSGLNIGGWSFSIDTSKGNNDMGKVREPLHFQVSEVFEYVNNSIGDLKLEKIQIEDNLYINGEELRDKKDFLPDPKRRPITKIEDVRINHFIKNPNYSVRHYKCIRVTDWKGEIILSVFLRFSMIGESLFIEVNYYLLTPLNGYYRKFDRMKPKESPEDIVNLVQETVFTTLFLSIASLISVTGRLVEPMIRNSQKAAKEDEIDSNPAFNYGAVTSLRERVSNTEYTHYFQQLDQEMYFKAIERRIIDSLSKFLDSKNVDTSDFKETRSTILNHGIIVSGSFKAKKVAVGRNSKLTSTNINIAENTHRAGDN